MMRPATIFDCNQLFIWRNMPAVYELGNGKEVDRTEHIAWFNQALTSNDVMLNIIEPKAGMVRVDLNDQRADISIYLMEGFKGKGLGTKAIKQATENAQKMWEVDVYATIHPGNERSQRAFTKAGYVECAPQTFVYRND